MSIDSIEYKADYETLKKKIEEKRKQMLTNGFKYGLTHEKTLNNSVELDILINKILKVPH